MVMKLNNYHPDISYNGINCGWSNSVVLKPVLEYHHPCTFCMSPYLTHLFQVLQSLLMSSRVESGVIDEGDIQNMQGWWYSRTGLRTTGLFDLVVFNYLDFNKTQ